MFANREKEDIYVAALQENAFCVHPHDWYYCTDGGMQSKRLRVSVLFSLEL